MFETDRHSPEAILWTRRLRRLALIEIEIVFAALSLAGLVVIFGCSISIGLSGWMILLGVFVLMASTVLLVFSIMKLVSMTVADSKAVVQHFGMALWAVGIGLFEFIVICILLNVLLTCNSYSREDYGFRTTLWLAWIEAFLIPAYFICDVSSWIIMACTDLHGHDEDDEYGAYGNQEDEYQEDETEVVPPHPLQQIAEAPPPAYEDVVLQQADSNRSNGSGSVLVLRVTSEWLGG